MKNIVIGVLVVVVIALIGVFLFVPALFPVWGKAKIDAENGFNSVVDVVVDPFVKDDCGVNDGNCTDPVVLATNPCPDEYDWIDGDPWHLGGYDCNSYADMLGMITLWQFDFPDGKVAGPYESPDDWSCEFYVWMCEDVS